MPSSDQTSLTRVSAHLIEEIFAQMESCVVITDEFGLVVFRSSNCREAIPEIEDCTTIRDIFALAQVDAESSLVSPCELRIGKEGSVRWLLLRSKLSGLFGKSVIFTITDITAQKEAENRWINREQQSIEKFRRKIAGDLHDDIGQSVVAIKLLLSSIATSPDVLEKTQRTARQCLDISETIISQIKRIT